MWTFHPGAFFCIPFDFGTRNAETWYGCVHTSSLQQNPSRAIIALAALGPQVPAA